jgi:hypothetical protein
MSSDVVVPVRSAVPADRSFYVGCLAGWVLAAGLMCAVWVLVLKL